MDLFSSNILNGVVASLLQPASFLLDRFFPNVQTEQTEEIHFDTISRTRRLAPFVSPLVEGKVVAGQGYKTSTFKPAYTKDKRVWDPNRPLRRTAGEQIGGSLAPMDRIRALVVSEMTDQLEMLTRRLEWMAAQVLLAGSVTVVGDNYPSMAVNFGRTAGLTVVLTGGNKWDQTGVNPLNDLQTWSQLVLKTSGSMPIDVVMDVAAWKVFRDNSYVKERINLMRQIGAAPTLNQSAAVQEGGVFMGTIDTFNIWVYSSWYIDDNGTEQPMIPAGTVIMSSPDLMGYRAFGAIRDEEAGYQAVPYFAKSWVDKDPAVRYLLMQSAPLVVPYRPDGMLCATVL